MRFDKLVEAAGRPESHLVLVNPENDIALRRALKANRVVTIHQPTVGTRTHHGAVGFDPGPCRQFLIFPRGVGRFKARRIVGIKYELLADADSQVRKKRAKPEPNPPRREKKSSQAVEGRPRTPKKPAPLKILPPPPGLSDLIRRALRELEAGKRRTAVKTLEKALADEKRKR